MKLFSQYTDPELLELNDQDLNDAIRREAIEKGIQPPIPLSEALRQSEWRGYKKPAESFTVFEIIIADKYGTPTPTGLAYLDEEKAISALDGAVSYDENRYSKGGPQIKTGKPSIRRCFIGVSPQESKAIKFDEFRQDNAEFDKIADECLARIAIVRQAHYDKRVNSEKKAEYLRLAGGNEEIAKGFWDKVERSEWPIE